MDDILIKGGEVVDGTGGPARRCDVAIRAGRIAVIGENSTDSAERIIDAEGKIVAPGFIDIHTHSDFTLPLNPKAEGKIRQGVTTEVVGNCGFSVAPALPDKVEELRRYLSGSAPWLPFEETNFADYMDVWPEVAAAIPQERPRSWQQIAEVVLSATGFPPRSPRGKMYAATTADPQASA